MSQSTSNNAASSRFRDYLSLTKPRLTAMVMLTSFLGYYLAAQADLVLIDLAIFLAATTCLAGGSAARRTCTDDDACRRAR